MCGICSDFSSEFREYLLPLSTVVNSSCFSKVDDNNLQTNEIGCAAKCPRCLVSNRYEEHVTHNGDRRVLQQVGNRTLVYADDKVS